MDDRNGTRLPSSLVSGRLEGISVPDLLWALCRHRSTGVLHVGIRGANKKVYIDGGRIVFAASSDPNDRLGELLLREGVVTLDQLERAITKLASGKRLGAILVESGHLSPDNLVRGVLGQVKGIVLGLFPLEEGEYAFLEGPLPTEEVVTLNMRTAEILLQGIRQIRSFNRIRKSVGSLATRFRLDPGWQANLDGLEIRDGERILLQHLDAAGAAGVSIDALCREVFLSNYEIYQALWAFRVLGIVHEFDRMSDAGSALEGRLSLSGLPEILVRLCRDSETGVLRVTRGSVERTFHIKEGLCVFATSNAIDDGLVAHLLRRGVISLRDREETGRRLLSNKRVGTILLEMGVIDESDLRATVREQLSEIVFDTFRWEDGDYSFLGGELPTIEEITLHRTIEDLVFAGVRRVTSWSRIREGCGGLGARLTLRPQYLEVLDKMSVGPEEWELISLLKTPKSILEICRESVLGDFRSCQILWAMRVLGAIGEAPIEASVDAILTTTEPVPAPAPDPAPGVEEEIAAAPAGEAPAEIEERHAIPLSVADESAEVISEPWRLAAERAPEPAEPVAAASAPEDETIAMDQEPAAADEAVEPPEEEDVLPRFELGEPGTGLEDMKVDMRPAEPSRDFALGVSTPEEPLDESHEPSSTFADIEAELAATEQLHAGRTMRISPEEVDAALRGPEAPAAVSMPEPVAPLPPPLAQAPAEPVAPPLVAQVPIEPVAAPPMAPMPAEPAAAAAPAPASDAWEPPEGLAAEIAAFNARHVIVFRALRTEVGAGAANFVRSCRASLGHGLSELFAGAELRADGSWDPDALRRAVVEHRMAEAPTAFRQLLEREMERLRDHLGEKRASAIAGQLAAIP